jgi:hypothetical protein
MKAITKKFIHFFKPTEAYKTAVQNISTGDIVYLMQGAIPNKEVAGWQIVTKVKEDKIFVTWGDNTISRLKRIRDGIINGTYKVQLQYWEPLIINPDTGYIKDHFDLKLNTILRNEAKIRIYPSMLLYYGFKYMGAILLSCTILGLCFWLASLF